ncbi:YciI family protein [Cytobacillus massiliigabonensis]|uniref:YciI family protein n=1 Tax=Cytobacillus massiliigabonensis TaxID=1871011 RepID=UPI000C817E95|nr:YciI family protein [Cytobacillus massiliigabonensis]
MRDSSYNDRVLYVILLSMKHGEKLSEPIIREHVSFLRNLEEKGQLVLCGPFLDYKGGMVIIKAESMDEARRVAESDPFVSSGLESYEIRRLEVSNEDNNHLGMG